jgi:hypothetical protein
MSEDKKKIWVLGGRASGADRSIPWQASLPNLSNSDILVIDLGTIPKNVSVPFYEIRNYLRYMIMAKKTIYVLLSTAVSEDRRASEMFPVFPNLIEIKPCDIGSVNKPVTSPFFSEIEEYCKYIEHCSFFINGIDSAFLYRCFIPKYGWNIEKYPFSDEIRFLQEELIFEIQNVSHQSIGLASDYRFLNSGKKLLHKTGNIIFLPPPTKITSTEAVEVLVNSLIGMELREDEPDWVEKIELPNVNKFDKEIFEKTKLIAKINKEIGILSKEKNKIEKHKKLLWTKDRPLEIAVKDAFVLLGFGEIREGRAKNLEDWVIDLKYAEDFVHGVMEVKGSEKKTSLGDINQCDKWVKEYRVKEKKRYLGFFCLTNLDAQKILTLKKDGVLSQMKLNSPKTSRYAYCLQSSCLMP